MQVAAGQWWDAVQLPAYLADRVLAALGETCGAVMRDSYAHRVCWLVPTGSTADWVFPEISGVQVFGLASWVTVPPADRVRSPALHWARPIGGGPLLTCPRLLHQVITEVLTDAFGPRKTEGTRQDVTPGRGTADEPGK